MFKYFKYILLLTHILLELETHVSETFFSEKMKMIFPYNSERESIGAVLA